MEVIESNLRVFVYLSELMDKGRFDNQTVYVSFF